MPGGKPTITSSLPDLASFIARRRGTIDQWLISNNITSPEALQALLKAGKWDISPALLETISELVKPISAPIQPVVHIPVVQPEPEEKVSVVVEPVVVAAEPQPEVLSVPEVVEQPHQQQEEVPVEHNDVVLEEPIVPFTKERKKSR